MNLKYSLNYRMHFQYSGIYYYRMFLWILTRKPHMFATRIYFLEKGSPGKWWSGSLFDIKNCVHCFFFILRKQAKRIFVSRFHPDPAARVG